MREYEVRDPVYGFIKINDLEKDIISLAFLILVFNPEFISVEEQGTDENAH